MADVNANIGIHIDTSQSLAEIKNLQRQLSQLYSSINKGSAAAAAAQKGLATNLMNTINASGKFYAQMGTIRTSTESFTHALEKNKLTMREYFRYAGGATRTFGRFFKQEFDTISRVAEERVKRMQTQYIKMGRDASGAMKAISVTPTTLNMKDYGNQVAVAAQRQALLNQLLKQGSTNLLNFGKNTQWAGRQLMVGFTIPLAYFGTAAAKTFMDLEAQALKFRRVYGDMFTTTDQTEKALSDIQKLAEEFSKYGVAVAKTMEMAANAAAMGKTGADLTAQVANATRLAVLGNVEQQQALETTISLTNAFGIAAEELASKINFLNAVENQTVVSIEDLTIAIPKAGPVVKQLGGDVEDLAFFLTAMKEGGINASEGANALKSGLASLINPTEKAAKFLGDMGVNINAIVEANKGNVRGIVVDFARALDTLDPLNRARAIEQLFGKFQFSRLSTLFSNVSKEGTQAARVLDLAGASVEQLAILSERELKAVEDAVGTDFRAAVEQLKVSIAPIGKEFLKAITPVVEFLGKLFDRFSNLGDGTKKFIVILTTLVGLVGPTLLMTFGLVANGAANIIKLFILMRQGFLKLSGNSNNLAQQTQYLNSEQMEAATVAASLNQAHSRLTQQFNLETTAVNQLRNAYVQATAAAQRFAAANPGMMMPGFRGIKGGGTQGFASGTTEVVGGQPGKDSVPSLLTPGEAVIPAGIAQDDRFKPLIAALVTGEIAKYQDGTTGVSLDDRIYNAKTAKGAKNIRDFMNSLIKNADGTLTYIDPKTREATTFTPQRLRQVFDYRSQPGKEFTVSDIKRSLDIGSGARGSSRGTSRPQWISELVKQAKGAPNVLAEQEAVKAALAQRGITGLTQDQQRNLFGVQASHLVEERDAQGRKVWRAANLAPEPGYINNYLNTVKGNLGKELLALTDDQLRALNIDKNELRKLVAGNHPTSANSANTLRSIAQYQIAKNPGAAGIYQAEAVVAGLNYRLKNDFYRGGLKTLAQLFPTNKKVMAEIAAAKGEILETKDGKRGVVTGQTGRPKPSGKNVTAHPRDTRILTTKNLARIFPYGIKGPRFAGAFGGADDGSTPAKGIRSSGLPQTQSDTLVKAIDDNTKSQKDGTETQEKTSKELKQEKRQARMQRMATVGMPVAMAAGTGAMMASMAGAPQALTNMLFGVSAVAGLLPLLMNPLGAVIAGFALVGAAIYKYNADLKKAREEGVAFAKAISMGTDKMKALSVLANTVSATEEARKRRENIAAGTGEGQRRFGQNILESDFGKQMLGDINLQAKAGLDNKQIAKNLATNLGQAVIQGTITTEQARSIASALGEKLGSYEIPALISGNLVQLLGPEGQDLFENPLDIALQIKADSMENVKQAFEQAMNDVTAADVFEELSGFSQAVDAFLTPFVNPMSMIRPAFTGESEIGGPLSKKRAAEQNAKIDAAAVQLGIELIGQNQQLVDGINRQYDIKVKTAKTEQEIIDLQKERKQQIDAINIANAKTLQDILKLSKNFTPDQFTKSINTAIDSLYKDSSDAVKAFVKIAQDSLNKLQDSKFKKTIQIGFASGELSPQTVSNILGLISENKDIQGKISLLITQEGFANTDLLMQLFAKTGADAATIDLMLNYVNNNKVDFDKDVEAVAAVANMQGTYGVTLDLKTNGTLQLQIANRALNAIKDLPPKLNFELVSKLAGENPAVFGPIKDNWQALSEGKDTISKNLVVNYSVGSIDPNIVAAAKAEGVSVGEYLAKGFIEPEPVPTGPVKTPGDKKGRDTTLDELLKRLKFIRDASINAQGGVKELLRITSGKGLREFVGVTQQLMAGPKGGANREFISFLEGMDNATRKTYMTIKNGQVVLTKQGKALKEAFNEKVIGEFQVANRQTLQDTKAQGAALLKLQTYGIDSATALEMVADANLAVAINSKDITGKELRQMAKDAKAAKDEVNKLNLEVLNLAEDLKKKVVDAGDAIKAISKAREAGIVDPEMLKRISQDQSLINKILSGGMDNNTVRGIIDSYKALDELGEITEGLIDPAKAAMEAFDKLKDAAFKVFDRQAREAQNEFENSMKRIATTITKLPAALEGLTIEGAIDKANEDIETLRAQIDEIEYRNIRPIDLKIEAAEASIEEFRNKLGKAASKLTLPDGKLLPDAAYDDVKQTLQDKISAAELDLEFNPQYGARFVEKLQDQVRGIELEIELNFSRPIAALQEETSDLSNDLTLMDRVADQINSKYDAQAAALQKVSDINQEILNQQRSQLDIAGALTQGDIAAAARAAQEARAQAADAASQRAGGVLDAARQAEISGIRSASGMTREQIEERQFQISQQIFQLEEQSEARQRSILALQDQIRGIEEIRTQKQREIRDIQDQLAAGERARDAFIRANILPLETQIKDLQKERQGFVNDIKLKEAEIAKIQNEILVPLEAEVQKRKKILDDRLAAIDAEKLAWENAQLALEKATGQAEKFAGQATNAQKAFESAKKAYDDIKSKDVVIRITEIVTRIVNTVSGSTTGFTGVTGSTLTGKMYGGFVKPMMYGGKVKTMAYGGKIKPMAFGGRVGSDSVPALLTPGEFVVNKNAAKRFGPFLSAINDSKFPSMIGRDIPTPTFSVPSSSNSFIAPVVNNSTSVSDNSSTVYNYNVGITVGGTNSSPDNIAKAVLNEIKYIDSQRIRGQRA